LGAVDGDRGSVGFEAEVDLGRRAHQVGVGVPPASLPGFAGQLDECVADGGVVDPVQVEQLPNVTGLDADLTRLHPADLRVRALQSIRSILEPQTDGLTEPAQLCAKASPADRRIGIRDHEPPLGSRRRSTPYRCSRSATCGRARLSSAMPRVVCNLHIGIPDAMLNITPELGDRQLAGTDGPTCAVVPPPPPWCQS
jgi:hypothetical protein